MRNNRKATIGIKCTSGQFKQSNLSKLVKLACADGFFLVCIRADVRGLEKNEDYRVLESIFSLVKRLRSESDCVILVDCLVESNKKLVKLIQKNKSMVDNVLVDSNSLNNCKLLEQFSTLRKQGVQCCIFLDTDDYSSVMDSYKKYVSTGFPIKTNALADYKQVQLQDVRDWIYDTEGTSLSVFSDIINRALLYYSVDCSFSSCIGNRIYVENDDGLLCDKASGLHTKSIFECDSYGDVFSSEEILVLLKQTIARRNACKEKCAFFSVCRGGCPLKKTDVENCEYAAYFSLIVEVKNELIRVIESGNLTMINPYVRNTIFLSMSSYRE